MAKREIIWSKNSEIQLHDILVFYINRNKSSSYSVKLYRRFKLELEKTVTNPEIGIKTKLDSIRGLIVGNYILYYEVIVDKIIVLKIWDCRQDPEKLRFK
jgi:plasmid stabilization system protein ParE